MSERNQVFGAYRVLQEQAEVQRLRDRLREVAEENKRLREALRYLGNEALDYARGESILSPPEER